ncbi:MAG TPA: PhnD/SsuA/transferrin family substrate-binding protein, partial [Elusimicrobiales bacterium]|nr:PhnD/SsuA/transferrin family substrate-binding protein [Elusimicrobiales bacterium]
TLWSREMGQNMEVTTEFFDNVSQVMEKVKANKLDMVIITGLEYLTHPDGRLLEPGMVGVASKASPLTELLLVVHKSAKVESLSQLRGGKFLFYAGVGGEGLGQLWLDTLLLRERLPVISQFCKFSRVDNVSKAVLPVFFRQAAAALVPKQSYDSMVELNPQVGRELVVFKNSPQLLATSTYFRKDYKPELKQEILDLAMRKRSAPAGRQIMTLFRVSDIVPLVEKDADSLRALIAEHKRLLKESKEIASARTK